MKTSLFSVGIVLLTAASVCYGGSASGRTEGPCFRVSIQNDRINESNVRQNCDRNFNRTVQAGARNSAQTVQTGSVTNNKVRQYHYDISKYLNRKHDR
jgi:hypothetical protein